MRLHRITISNWRLFGEEPRTFDFDADVTVVTGPNESGKSSLFDAVRAALFDIAGSKGFEDISPWGSAGAEPRVILEFSADDSLWRIEKTLGAKGKALLEQHVGGAWQKRTRDKVACHDVIALVGSEAPKKLRTEAPHWGPQQWLFMPDSVRSLPADGTRVLESEIDCVTPDFERVVAKVETEYARWYAPKGGELKTKTAELHQARSALAAVESEVERLTVLRQEVESDDERHRDLAARLPSAESALEDERRSVDSLASELAILDKENERIATLRSEEARAAEKLERLERLLRERSELRRQRDLAAAERQEATRRSAEAAVRVEQAADHLDECRQGATQALAGKSSAQTARDAAILARRLARARTLDARVLEARENVVEGPDEDIVRRARELVVRVEAARARALAGALDVTISGAVAARVFVDDASIEAGEAKAYGQVRIEFPHGSIIVKAPGAEAVEAAREAEAMDVELRSTFSPWNVASLQELEALASRARTTRAALSAAESERRNFTEDTTAALRAELKAQGGSTTEPSDEDFATLEEGVRHATEATVAARAALESADAAHRALLAEHASAKTHDGAAAATEKARSEALERHLENGPTDDLKKRHHTAREAHEEASAERRRLEESLLPRRSALTRQHEEANGRRDEAEAVVQELRTNLASLRLRLEEPARAAVYTELTAAETRFDELSRRVSRLDRRARATALARRALEKVRAASSQNLSGPVSERLRAYLDEVTNGKWTDVALDGSMNPAMLGGRALTDGSEGLRELVSVLTRLAVAVDLAESGPRSVILDDPCAHVDADRLERLALLFRRVLDEQPALQLVLLTNRPEEFEALQGRRLTLGERPDDGSAPLRLRA